MADQSGLTLAQVAVLVKLAKKVGEINSMQLAHRVSKAPMAISTSTF